MNIPRFRKVRWFVDDVANGERIVPRTESQIIGFYYSDKVGLTQTQKGAFASRGLGAGDV
jgi:hypothetical protein